MLENTVLDRSRATHQIGQRFVEAGQAPVQPQHRSFPYAAVMSIASVAPAGTTGPMSADVLSSQEQKQIVGSLATDQSSSSRELAPMASDASATRRQILPMQTVTVVAQASV